MNLPDLVAGATNALLPHLEKPFAFFGHSLGALVSFEVTRTLRRRGLASPVRLFMSAHRAPQLPNPHAPLHGLPDGELISEICRHYAGIPQAVLDDPELLALMIPGLRADFTVFETYRYVDDAPLMCPISVFGGAEDRRVSEAELAGWKVQTHGGFTRRMLDGDHFFLQPRRDEVIAAVCADLAPVGVGSLAGPFG
jgi:medium-chain acyl-[acyl-carrier-protein] hydrolase